MKIVFFGTPEFSAYILEELIKWADNPQPNLASFSHSHPGGVKLPKFVIQAVVTNPPQPVGRRQTLTPSPVYLVAQKNNIPPLTPEKLDQAFITSHSSLLTSHLFIVASYGKIIPQSLLDIPTLGSLNVHPSLLPKYRGPSPIQAAILNGDKETGITIMLMDEKMDHGPLLKTKQLSISEEDNYQTLSNKLSSLGVTLLLELLPRFVSGKITPKPQDYSKATFTKLIKKVDGYFDINNPPAPEVLDRMIKAYYPWPTAWTNWSFDSAQDKKERIVKFLPGGLVQMEGKNSTPLKNFLNGYPDFPIKQLLQKSE